MRPHRGVLILVFGILSLVISCLPFGIVAWVMGNGDLRAMDSGLMDPSGRDQTNAGRICGIIGTILFILGLLLMVVYLVIIAAAISIGATNAAQDSKNRAPTYEYTPAPER